MSSTPVPDFQVIKKGMRHMQNTREEMVLLTIRDEVGLAIRYQSQLLQVGVGILTRKNSNKFVYKYYSKQLIYSYES